MPLNFTKFITIIRTARLLLGLRFDRDILGPNLKIDSLFYIEFLYYIIGFYKISIRIIYYDFIFLD